MQLTGIYKITSPSGKIYIGQSEHIIKRLKGYKRLACKSQPLLYNSLKKYTFNNHNVEILVEGNFNQKELDDWEIYYIQKYNSFVGNSKKGLNLTTGGSSNFKVSKQVGKKQTKSRMITRDKGLLPNVKLTKEDVFEIKKLIAYNYEKRAIGKLFNVAETTIAEIFSGRNWKDVPDYILTDKDLPFILPKRKQLTKKQVGEIKWLLDNTTLSYKNIGLLYNIGTKTIHYYNNETRREQHPINHKKYKTRFLTQKEIYYIKNLLKFNLDIATINLIFNIDTAYINVKNIGNLNSCAIEIPDTLDDIDILTKIINYSLISTNQLCVKFNVYNYTFKKYKL